MYFISATLLVLYLFVLAKSFDTSNTPELYQKYFVTNEMKYYNTQEKFISDYSVDTLCNYSADGNYKNHGTGWLYPEETATWTEGNKSDMYFYISDPSASYTFQITVLNEMGYNNRLFVNGIDKGALTFENGVAEINISDGLFEGINTFSICTEDNVVKYNESHPESDDSRRINLYVKEVILYTSSH